MLLNISKKEALVLQKLFAHTSPKHRPTEFDSLENKLLKMGVQWDASDFFTETCYEFHSRT